MSNQKLILIILLVAFSLTACKKSQEVGSLSEEDVVKLKNISPIWAQAIMDRDWDKAASIYAEDGVRLGEYPPIRGRDAIREWLAAPTSETIESFSVSNIRVEGYGDLAYIWDSAS